jgi:methionyl-tRNA formyltransferase
MVRIAVAGAQSSTIDLVKALIYSSHKIDYIINPGPNKEHMISDYQDLEKLTNDINAKLLRPKTYTMKDNESIDLFDKINIDILIVVGWQRLIPAWLLTKISIGAFGMHGSSEPLPRGRGRSPMNWSIIEGKNKFITNLFKYDEGIDSGEVVDTQTFDIYPWDTIATLQHKNTISQIQLILKNLPKIIDQEIKYIPQRTDIEPTYYPKRVPEDGVINWRDSSENIFSLVKAVTYPYPGAFTYDGKSKIFIWEGHPFDSYINFSNIDPGQIVFCFHDCTFIIKTNDSSFYVTKWESFSNWRPQLGVKFKSRKNFSWEKLKNMNKENLNE